MPLRSKAQMRFLFAAEKRGEVKPGTAKEFVAKTPSIKRLPDRVSKKKTKKRRP